MMYYRSRGDYKDSMYYTSITLSTGRAVPVPFNLMKYSLSAFLLILSIPSATRDSD